jgi:hypothetical protein
VDVSGKATAISRPESALGSPNRNMTQTSSAIIVAIRPWMEYVKLCMSMHIGNARYSADPGVG